MAKKRTPKPPKKPRPKPIPPTGGGAPKGNRNAEKLATPDARADAFRKYCLHLAAGFSGGCFYEPVLEETILAMVARYPAEFDMDEMRRARARGRMYWEDVGNKGTVGKIRGFNAHAWKFNMQNRLGWKDRSEMGLDKETRAVFKLKMGKDLDGKGE